MAPSKRVKSVRPKKSFEGQTSKTKVRAALAQGLWNKKIRRLTSSLTLNQGESMDGGAARAARYMPLH
jgi:hypothetical protein